MLNMLRRRGWLFVVTRRLARMREEIRLAWKKLETDPSNDAVKHVYNVNIPGCSQPGKLFVGQRKEPFAVNLGTIFDLDYFKVRSADN